jgi:hypothetical protein
MPYGSYMVPSMPSAKNQSIPVPTTVRFYTAYFRMNLLIWQPEALRKRNHRKGHRHHHCDSPAQAKLLLATLSPKSPMSYFGK